MIRAFLRLNPSPESFRGWRSVLWPGLGLLIVVLVPQVGVLLTAGFLGGVLVGASLIVARREFRGPGSGGGTPIVLFPRPANISAGRA